MRRKQFEDIPIFNQLPTRMCPKRLLVIIEEFKRCAFTHRDEFIEAHTRLATSVALSYGYFDNRGDDLIGVTLIELCKFPQIVADGGLKNDNILGYLLSRLNFACKHHIDLDRIYGPSRGHVNNTGINVTRQHFDSPKVQELMCVDDQSDLVTDLKNLIRTNKEDLVLKAVLSGFTDKEIARQFGWRSSQTVSDVTNGLVKKYKIACLENVRMYLPYPDFKSSVNCLDNRTLGKQCKIIREILSGLWIKHPASLMWRGHRWQLCNLGLYSADNYKLRGNPTNDDFEWFLRCRENLLINCDKSMPFWFDNDKLHANHRGELLHIDEEYYSQFGWEELEVESQYWPVVDYTLL